MIVSEIFGKYAFEKIKKNDTTHVGALYIEDGEETMIEKIFNHFQLTWRLMRDQRVQSWLKLFIVIIPLIYVAIPAPDDFIPIIGLLDDLIGLPGTNRIDTGFACLLLTFHENDKLTGLFFSDRKIAAIP